MEGTASLPDGSYLNLFDLCVVSTVLSPDTPHPNTTCTLFSKSYVTSDAQQNPAMAAIVLGRSGPVL
jgi:hypothetical protein